MRYTGVPKGIFPGANAITYCYQAFVTTTTMPSRVPRV